MKKVMVVDDDPDTLELVRLVLATEGFSVTTALGGKECLGKLEEENPDAVLLDIMMPEMDGWEVLKAIREKYAHLRVAMLSAMDRNHDRMTGWHGLKADDYITKPFVRMELVKRVRKLVGL